MDGEVIQEVGRLARAVQRALRDPVVLAEVGLTGVQARALAFVARHPGGRQQAFVEGTGRDKGQVARVFKELVRRGLIERRPDPTDRRASTLHLSAEGASVAESLLAHRHRVANALEGELTAGERRQLLDLLARVRAGLERSSVG